MITYSNGFLEKYYADCRSGQEIVGEELMTELTRLIEDMNGEEWVYDTIGADRRMDFMEHCIRLTKSPFYGKPMVLMPWQRAFISALYGFYTLEGRVRFQRALLLIARKNAKALALDTPIFTPDGWRTIEDVQSGDFVYDEYGRPVRVKDISPIFHNHDCYAMIFEDGERIVTDAGHLWTVKNKDKHELETLTTEELAKNFAHPRKDGKGIEYRYRVPKGDAIEGREVQLPLHPYVLGVWLGDGDKGDNRIACAKSDVCELVKHLTDAGVTVGSILEFDGKHEVRIGSTYARLHGGLGNSVRDALREIRVWNNKHIPSIYLECSVSQRWELLQGLMDTDGTVSKAGQCVWAQSDARMVEDFSKLLASLGIKHTMAWVKTSGRDACRVQFWTDASSPCFKYARKLARLKPMLNSRMRWKSIRQIISVKSVPTKCIHVDSDSGLFRVGNRHTVTHNSETCSALLLTDLILGGEGRDIVCSSNDNIQADILYQACDTMRLMIDPKSLDTWRSMKWILCKENDNKIFRINDNTRNKEGRNIDLAVVDEVHEMKDNTIVKSIEQSQSLKDDPLMVLITTEGFVNGGFLDAELKRARAVINDEVDDSAAKRYLPWLYTQDDEREVWEGNRENRLWMKSNPSLGTVKKWDYLEQQIDLARLSKADRAFVLAKDFNLKQSNATAWLLREDFDYDATFDIEDFRNSFYLGGVDLSETTDLTCAKALLMRNGDSRKYLLGHYFIPAGKLERSDDRSAGARYDQWAREGYLTICDGNYLDVSIIADWYMTLYRDYGLKPYMVGYDMKFATGFINRMDEYGFPIEVIYQGPEVMDNPVKMLETDLRSHLVSGSNDLDKWCYGNASLKVDSRGLGMLTKIDGQPSRRIDGAVATAIAYEVYRRHRTDYERILAQI